MKAILDSQKGDSRQEECRIMTQKDVEVNALDVRVWSAIDTDVLLHIHIGDGTLEGPLAGESRLDFDRDYRVRARFRDDSGAANDLSDWSVWVPFSTAPQWAPFPMLLDELDRAQHGPAGS